MKVVFRADAGIDMGIGHVMRCLTLADALSARGHSCRFICRDNRGNIARQIELRGHRVTLLSQRNYTSGWLGAGQEQDAADTLEALSGELVDWFVTDNYSIGAPWERVFRRRGSKVLAIDDLANRAHECDLLLDQTLGRHAADYAGLVPDGTVLLLGASVALLRPQFAELRQQSMRRGDGYIARILVSLGGADAANHTASVIEAIERCPWPEPMSVDIVLGGVNPWIAEVSDRATRSAMSMRVLVDVSNMAELMLQADLAIGTAGTTSWERCCLGLPSILVVAADNQRFIAQALSSAGAAVAMEASMRLVDDLASEMNRFALNPSLLVEMSEKAALLVDGAGCERVAVAMEAQS